MSTQYFACCLNVMCHLPFIDDETFLIQYNLLNERFDSIQKKNVTRKITQKYEKTLQKYMNSNDEKKK